MDYTEVISAVALFLSLVNIILYYRFSHKALGASIVSGFTDLPPYKSDDQMTTITTKNIGTSGTTLKEIILTFSWDKDLKLVLFQKSKKENMCLFPNETITFRKRLPEPPPEKNEIITITTRYDGWVKYEEFPIKIIKGEVSFTKSNRRVK